MHEVWVLTTSENEACNAQPFRQIYLTIVKAQMLS